MSLCNRCEATTINGMRVHERGCPNDGERIVLVDDGTMDTVFRCNECGEEMRYNYDPSTYDDDEKHALGHVEPEAHYNSFVRWALRDAQDEHDCTAEEDSIEEDD